MPCAPATTPRARPSWMPATSWACWCSLKCPAGSTSATKPGRRRPCRTAGRWCASAATIPVCFCGVHGSTAAPMMKPFTSAPTRPSIGWTPPAPRRVPISAAASSCWRMCTPTTIIPTGAEAPPVRPAPPSPRTPARATSSASSAGRTSRPSPLTMRPTGWCRPCILPPCSTIPLPSRAWPAALAGAWPTTTPTGNSAAATASATTA